MDSVTIWRFRSWSQVSTPRCVALGCASVICERVKDVLLSHGSLVDEPEPPLSPRGGLWPLLNAVNQLFILAGIHSPGTVVGVQEHSLLASPPPQPWLVLPNWRSAAWKINGSTPVMYRWGN